MTRLNTRQNLIKKHPVELSLGAIAVVLLLSNLGLIQKAIADRVSIRSQANEIGKTTQQLTLDETKREELAKIANERMKTCEIVYSINPDKSGGLQFTPFGDGSPIVKGEYSDQYRGRAVTAADNPGHFLPAGMTVCSAYGNTGITVVDGSLGPIAVVRSYAVATDKAAIDEAIARAQKASRPLSQN